MRAIGLMSGTSLDGIDAALVTLDGAPDDVRWHLDAFVSVPYDDARRATIHQAIEHGGAAGICALHAQLGEWLAHAALAVCSAAGIAPEHVDVIGSHGQTVWHDPPHDGQRGATLQLGCAATIAERTGVPVVSDFRARDMAAGGHGAPLVPWLDRMLFAADGRVRVMQNIGGMANLTRVPPRGSTERLVAFDTGPGNALIDAAAERATSGEQSFDRDGLLANSGAVDEALLEELLAHPYFREPPPKSTGREVFGRPFVEQIVRARPPQSQADWCDLIATLTTFTARTIADAIDGFIKPLGADEVVVTGGGARNPLLMRLLRDALAPLPVLDGSAIGIDPDAKEALAFAALAWAHVNGVAGNVPEATGAEGLRVLGSYTPGAAHSQPPLRG
jgi:anhydro-N-acetylmuramic acid kinase